MIDRNIYKKRFSLPDPSGTPAAETIKASAESRKKTVRRKILTGLAVFAAMFILSNGVSYAASMNGYPHGTQTIKNNNFAGHFCIHFTGSKTHGTKKVDSAHQNCVKTALKHEW